MKKRIASTQLVPNTVRVYMANVIAKPAGKVRCVIKLTNKFINVYRHALIMGYTIWKRPNASATGTGPARIVRKVSVFIVVGVSSEWLALSFKYGGVVLGVLERVERCFQK